MRWDGQTFFFLSFEYSFEDIGILQGDEFKTTGVSLKIHLKAFMLWNCVKDAFEYEGQVGIHLLSMGPHSKQGKWVGHISWFRKC